MAAIDDVKSAVVAVDNSVAAITAAVDAKVAAGPVASEADLAGIATTLNSAAQALTAAAAKLTN